MTETRRRSETVEAAEGTRRDDGNEESDEQPKLKGKLPFPAFTSKLSAEHFHMDTVAYNDSALHSNDILKIS